MAGELGLQSFGASELQRCRSVEVQRRTAVQQKLCRSAEVQSYRPSKVQSFQRAGVKTRPNENEVSAPVLQLASRRSGKMEKE